MKCEMEAPIRALRLSSNDDVIRLDRSGSFLDNKPEIVQKTCSLEGFC